jgi:ABC-type dipeptide/oligopeptide/nickel transport system permease component
VNSGGRLDNSVTTVTYVLSTFPTFLLGFLIMWLFAIVLNLTPVDGMVNGRESPAFGSDLYWQYFSVSPAAALLDLGAHLILPVMTLVIVSFSGRMPSSAGPLKALFTANTLPFKRSMRS